MRFFFFSWQLYPAANTSNFFQKKNHPTFFSRQFEATSSDFALLLGVLKALQGFALLVLMPLMSKVLGMHDALIVALCTFV